MSDSDQKIGRQQEHRKREESIVQASAAHLEEQHRHAVEILESISDAFYAIDGDFRFTYVNWKAEQLWGRPRQELLGKKLWEEFPQLEGGELLRMHLEAMQQRKPVQFEAEEPVLQGWIDANIYPEARGGLSCYLRDVSHRKSAQDALHKSQERYRTLFESIDEGFCVIEVLFDDDDDPRDYVFLEVNPAFEKQTGLVGAVGKRMLELVPLHERHWFEIYGRVATTGESVRFVNRANELRGGVWYDVNAFRLGGEDSRKVAILFKDITAQKRAEEEIQLLNNRLEMLVSERTRQLTQANEELDSFNYSVSHDLRAPLRAVDGFAQALVEDYGDTLDPTARSYLERVRAGAERMGQLIEDLLRLSRLSRSRLARKRVDLTGIAADTAEIVRNRDPGRRLEFDIAHELTAEGDSGLLRVALENLLENAWKFSRDAEEARIEVGSEQREGETIYFVRDNGAGFDQRYSHKLFAPFGRLHSPERFEGTGVGLAMVQRVIHLHGGRIWGEGKVDEGAAFYFTLPPSEGSA